MGVIIDTAMADLMTFRDIDQFPFRVSIRMTWEDQHAKCDAIDEWIAEHKLEYRTSGLFWVEANRVLEMNVAFKDSRTATLFKLTWG